MAQVQGEEIYLSHSGQEVDDNIDEVVAARGSEASLSARMAEIVGDFEADQQRQETEIGTVAALGAKNLLKLNTASQTINGVTFTVNDDQTITVNGTASANADFSINTALPLTEGSYILSGCPSGGNNSSTYKMQIQSIGYDTGNGLTFNLSAARNNNVYIRIWSGYTANNLVFKPMIRRSEITDDTYAPYAPTNRELYETEQRQALRYEDSAIIRLNQLSWSQTSSGSGMWIADCYTAQSIDTIVSVLITSFGALKPAEIKTLFTYIPSSVSGMHTVRLVCDQNLANISSNPTLFLRVFGYGYQASSLRSAPASLMQAGRIGAELMDAGTDESEEEER